MAISRQVDLLEPVNLADHLTKVELYLGQVCQIAGISKMQLDYWTNKAQIPTKGKKQRIYDIDALETVMLIKQAKDKGLNLGAAIEAARRFREESEVLRTSCANRTQPPKGLRCVLGCEGVDPPTAAELRTGEDRSVLGRSSRCQCGRVVQPRVQRHRAARRDARGGPRRRAAQSAAGSSSSANASARGSAGAMTSS